MRLHVLAGGRELLRPDLLDCEQAAELAGARVRVATAFWLSGQAGCFYHDFLQEPQADRRVEVFALSLAENFGSRLEPMVILPELLDGGAAPPAASGQISPLDLLCALWKHGRPTRITLHAVAFPSAIDPEGAWAAGAGLLVAGTRTRLEDLREACAAQGMDADDLDIAVTEMGPGIPAFARLYRNALAHLIAAGLGDRLEDDGFAVDLPAVRLTVAGTLRVWEQAGFAPAFGLRAEGLKRISDRVAASLQTGAGGNG